MCVASCYYCVIKSLLLWGVLLQKLGACCLYLRLHLVQLLTELVNGDGVEFIERSHQLVKGLDVVVVCGKVVKRKLQQCDVVSEVRRCLVIKCRQELVDVLNRGEVDAVFSGMLDTSARRKLIDFSDVYDVQTPSYGVLVRKNEKYANAESLSDFVGATFVAQKDSNLDRAIAQIKGAIHLQPVVHVSEIFEKLINGEADATVLDLDSAETYRRVYPSFKIIKFDEGKGFHFDFTGICAGVRKNDKKLLEEINAALKSISKRDRQRIMDQTISRSWENP